ncbi:MAG: acyl-CoA thioesterase [Desulfatiglandales bacterium]
MEKTFSIPIEIRFRDLDAMGHVNNAVYFTYFEEARKAFILKLFEIKEPSDYFFILADISCTFLKPIQLGDKVNVTISVGEIRNKSFTFKYKIVHQENPAIIFAEGSSTQVYYDYKEKRSKTIPENIKEILLSHVSEKI